MSRNSRGSSIKCDGGLMVRILRAFSAWTALWASIIAEDMYSCRRGNLSPALNSFRDFHNLPTTVVLVVSFVKLAVPDAFFDDAESGSLEAWFIRQVYRQQESKWKPQSSQIWWIHKEGNVHQPRSHCNHTWYYANQVLKAVIKDMLADNKDTLFIEDGIKIH